MKKSKKIIIILAIIILMWFSVFAVDLVRCNNLDLPLFARAEITADDGGSGIYKGPGYTVEIERHIDAEYGARTDYVEMRLFGILVLAIIVD